jgi:predicted  nucleic acid-binding Zn-ribbon protein
MSVRLQKEELGATREELRLTREEHAASRIAQERQARVALVTSQLDTLKTRLSAISGKLTYYREALIMWIQHSNLKNVHYQVKCADGGNRKIDDVIAYTLDKVKSLEAQQEALLQQIETLSNVADEIPSSAVQ